MTSEHMVKSFGDELKRLHDTLSRMGRIVETQIEDAILAVSERDSMLAAEVISNDAKVDQIEREIDDLSLKIMGLRQPVAVDLRAVVSALRIASELERIGDYAVNVAKRAIVLNQSARIGPASEIAGMGGIAKGMIRDVVDAYVQGDVDRAIDVWTRDEELDQMYSSLFRVLLTYMMEDARNITSSTHLLFIAKNIERVGDHTTNVAEMVYFLVNGRPLRAERPKHDETSFLSAV